MKALPVAVATAAAVAGLGLWLSFVALSDLAARAGLGAFEARAWAVVIDGLIVVSTLAVYSLDQRRAYAWTVFLFASTASLAANVTHSILAPGELPLWLSGAIAAAPPLSHLIATHLTCKLIREHARRDTPAVRADMPEPDDRLPAPLDEAPRPPALHAVAAPAPELLDDAPTAERANLREPELLEPELLDEGAPASPPESNLEDPRARALAAIAAGAKQHEAAALVGVHVRTVRRWLSAAAAA